MLTGSEKKQVIFKVQRYNPDDGSGPRWDGFSVPWRRGMTVLDGLIFIKENLDSTLAFRTSCRMAICGSCGMLVNNYPHLACHTQIEEFHSGTLTVKPLANLPVIKDLVVDLTTMFINHKSVKPFIIRKETAEMETPTREFRQTSGELDAFEQFSYCVKCGICLAACPTSASDRLFLGPQALAQCYHYSADTRDDGEKERNGIAAAEHGVWRCHLAGACSEACPKGVDPALAIQLLKRQLAYAALGLGKKKLPAKVTPIPEETKPKIPFPEFTANK